MAKNKTENTQQAKPSFVKKKGPKYNMNILRRLRDRQTDGFL